jgi:hypothetical protein
MRSVIGIFIFAVAVPILAVIQKDRFAFAISAVGLLIGVVLALSVMLHVQP